ncbi:hypothetical protein ACSAZK_01685 [Methanosarcina sp. Mfa9]|uniref:hypothetical protein n=1 Tax=Methanosarcina sp. Mfa9 TaxID=3439063 RepID=UPI003F82D69A
MDKQEEESMIGVCPNCGKPFRIEPTGGDGWRYCAEVCVNPSAIPAGARLQADQATLHFVDSNMHEYTREEYIKVHGIDPLPIWKAIEQWREEKMKKWKDEG